MSPHSPSASILSSTREKKGFTLTELIISITISAFILAGLTLFIMRMNTAVYTASNKGKSYVALTDFIERVNGLKNSYSTGQILFNSAAGYDVLLFTNTGSTAGVLIGVVNNDSTSTGYLLLDPDANYSTYGNKAIGVQELSQTQLSGLNSVNVYSIPFHADKVYSALVPQTFSIASYASGSVFEIHTYLFTAYESAYR